ncbi:MAG: hypothetical protein M3N93_11160 [Acidobacteriota bacterium]|nr:hypothetical protein [Acidobacteriota bacterium]
MSNSLNATGEQLTGSTRTAQRAIWDAFAIASAAPLNTNATKKMFTTNVVDTGGVTGDVSNMRLAGMLPAGHSHIIRAIRIEMQGASADLLTFNQFTFLKFFYSGIQIFESTIALLGSGMGMNGSASNGLPDARAIYFFDKQPIRLEGMTPFRLEVVSGATGNASAAFFLRAYLDGEYTEPA